MEQNAILKKAWEKSPIGLSIVHVEDLSSADSIRQLMVNRAACEGTLLKVENIGKLWNRTYPEVNYSELPLTLIETADNWESEFQISDTENAKWSGSVTLPIFYKGTSISHQMQETLEHQIEKQKHRVSMVNKEFEGTGIGLASIQRIMSLHRRNIWAESGSRPKTFYFYFNDEQKNKE